MGHNFDRFWVFPGTILMITNVHICGSKKNKNLELIKKIEHARNRDDWMPLIWFRNTFIFEQKKITTADWNSFNAFISRQIRYEIISTGIRSSHFLA